MHGATYHTLLTFDPIIPGIPFTDHCELFIQRSECMDDVCCYYMHYFETLLHMHSGALLVVM